MLLLERFLAAATVAELDTALRRAHWDDGSATAGELARAAKRNRQLAADSPIARAWLPRLAAALLAHPEVVAAALPRRVLGMRFNRYGEGDRYDAHVDAALVADDTGALRRADISATLFLSAPDSYDGGELEIATPFGVQRVKAHAGALVVYPASSLHRVTPITRGVRFAAILWLESFVADGEMRASIYELDRCIRALRARERDEAATVLALTGVYHNLIRRLASS